MLCVDSAADELLGGSVMRHGARNDPSENAGITPNLKITIRDATHAARRCSRKPEQADEYLTHIVKNLFGEKSLTWRVQHSMRWSSRFGQLCKDIEHGMSTHGRIKNLRAGAHRHESTSKPRMRFVLFFEAFYALAKEMLATSNLKEDRELATEFFTKLCTHEILLQAAMLADGQAEGLAYVRATDSEDTDVSEVHHALRNYLLKLETLFIEGQSAEADVTCFTQHMVQSLQEQRIVNIRGKMYAVGGAAFREELDALIIRCGQRMIAFTKVAASVGKAEFPDYDICCSFRCFSREVVAGLVAGSVLSPARLPADVQTCLGALARFYGLPTAEVMSQYVQMLQPVHLQTQSSTQSMQQIWASTLRGSSGLSHASPLWRLVGQFLLYTVSTAKVEQNWSKLKKVLGEQRLAGSEDRESRMSMIVLEFPSSKAAGVEALN